MISASNFSPQIDHQFFILLGVSSFFVFLVVTLIAYFCIKYRAAAEVNRDLPEKKPSSFEIILAVTILIFGVSMFTISAKVFFHLYSPPDNARTIEIVAKQWLWTFHDPRTPAFQANTPDKINELTLTLGEPVRLHLISEDVIHSFYVPAFRVKQDVLPDRYTTLWFTPTLLGDFEVFCTQYCGLRHSEMRAMIHVVAVPLPVSATAPTSRSPTTLHKIASRGARLLQSKGCLSCHGSKPIAPLLDNLFGTTVQLNNGKIVVADEAYLRRAILNPAVEVVQGYSNLMPSYQGQLSEIEIDTLIEAMKKEQK